MSEVIVLVQDAPEGGLTARVVGADVFTEADTFAELREAIRDAVRCHYADPPRLIRLRYTREEVIEV